MPTLNIEVWTPNQLRLASDFLNKLADDNEKTNAAQTTMAATPEAQAAAFAARRMSAAIDVVGDAQTIVASEIPPGANGAAAPLTATVVEPPKRGRPRKNAQPAVAENTGSTAVAELPATEPAATNAAGIESPKVGEGQAPVGRQDPEPQPSLTHDLVKAKLQDVMHAAKDQNTGMAAAYEIVKKYGYTHVRDIKPEHFASIHADAMAQLKEIAK